MADIAREQQLMDADLPAHEQTYHSFNKLVLFAILHIGLVLSCMAMAFVGHVPVFALFLGVGGTIALLAAFAILS